MMEEPEASALPEPPESKEVAPSEEKASRKKRRKDDKAYRFSTRRIFGSIFRWLFRAKLPLLPVVIIALALAFGLYRVTLDQGMEIGRDQAQEEASRPPAPFPPAIASQLRTAMIDLRGGNPLPAVITLQKLDKSSPPYPSISYLLALAALQAGNVDLAEEKALESIARKERVSDSYSLRAVVASQKAADPNRITMGNSLLKSEEMLRLGIAADPSNPYSHFELANVLRYKRQKDDALEEIKTAQALLNPMDSHLVMNVTGRFIEIEDIPIEELRPQGPATDDPRQLLPAALAAMRLGDFEGAAALLRKCEPFLSPDVFDYLVNDPALRRFAKEPALAPFYKN